MKTQTNQPSGRAYVSIRIGGGRFAVAALFAGLCATAPVLAGPTNGSYNEQFAGATEILPEVNVSWNNAKKDAAMDPFLAGALGIIPFASGLYVSDRPARGILFTAVDVLMVMGVYTSRYTAAGDPNNARNYFILMAANNILDAWVSVRYANSHRGTALILPTPNGGLQAAMYWRF
jgi:hypothetical protein